MDTVSRVVCFYMICGLIVILVQAGTIVKRHSDNIEDEKAELLVELLDKLTSASKLKSPRNMVHQDLSRALRRGGANHNKRGWLWGDSTGWCVDCRTGTKWIDPKKDNPRGVFDP